MSKPSHCVEELERDDGKRYASDLIAIQRARKLLEPFVKVTPVLTSSSLDGVSGRKLFFKCEQFQKGGAFKFRGAANAIFSLPDEALMHGVVTHSSGNHGGAVALAASLRGIPAHVVMPKNAPACKVENVRRYGGHIVFSEEHTIESRERAAADVQKETGAVMIHPFNDPYTISGQGTIAVELLEQVPQLDAIVVPISGGGLISGIAIASKALKPSIKVFAAEPTGADDAAKSKLKGHIVTLAHTNTIADGLRAHLGCLTWPVVQDLVEDVILVEDSAIVEATKMCFERLKVVVEPSGAIGLAAVLSKQFQENVSYQDCLNIGIVLSGGNIEMDSFWGFLNGC